MLKRITLLVLATTLLFPLEAFAENFVILTGEWAPYVSEKLPAGGPTTKIISEALKAAGHTATFEYVPWKRTEKLTQSGQAAGTFPWTSTPQFEKSCYVSSPVATQKMSFFFLKDKHPGWDFTTLEDLKKYSVGGSEGYSYVGVFKEAGIEADYAPDITSSMKKLIHGRVDFVPESRLVGMDTLKKNFPGDIDKIAYSETPLFEKPLSLMASKKNPKGKNLHEAFEQGLKIIKADGTYQAIIDEYGLE